MLDQKDIQILSLIQENCKMSLKELARKIGLPVTTTHARVKRLEKLGLIKGYQAILDAKKLGFGVTAFILVSFSYRSNRGEVSQRQIARKIASFPEVQEVHIVTGDWDIILKVKVGDVDEESRTYDTTNNYAEYKGKITPTSDISYNKVVMHCMGWDTVANDYTPYHGVALSLSSPDTLYADVTYTYYFRIKI